MTIINGQYEKLTEQEITDALEQELQDQFGADIDLTESSVFSTLISTLAAVLAENQEKSLQDVYQSAFLDTATGIDLERIVALIGLQRRQATHATGVQRFLASGKVTQDYVIQRGTTVQTGGGEPIEFETTDVTILKLIDSFENGNLDEYNGNTTNASTLSVANAPEGSNVLELDATEDASIYQENTVLKRGSVMHCYVRPDAGTVPIMQFGIQQSDVSNYYQVAVDEANDTISLERFDSGSLASTIDSTNVTISSNTWYEIEVDWNITDNISVTLYDIDGNELATLGGIDDTYIQGLCGFKSGDNNGTKQFDWYTTSEVSVNIRAIEGGSAGNVGPNSITSIPSPPAGVNATTNLYSTGDLDLYDLEGTAFIVGRDREEDDELRERAEEAVAGGGTSTHDALAAALINDIIDVISVTIYENKTSIDNSGSGGLPPHSFEAVVYGGDETEIARTIFDNKAITSNDIGGVRGTKVTETVQSNVNNDERQISFTRPTKQTVDITINIVTSDSYIGDNNLKDLIVKYIGGTLSDSTNALGLSVGKDVRIDQLRDIIVGEDTGVIGFDQSVDGTPISTTPSTTTVSGLQIVDIGENEVAKTDATDGSITINKTEL